MKPKEYVKKYKLKESADFNHNDFIVDFTADFMSVIEYLTQANPLSMGRYDTCVKEIRQKWTSISIKTKGTGLPEKLWKYFYATVIMKIKENIFSAQMKAKKERYEQRQREKQSYNDWMNGGFGFQDMFNDFMGGIFASLKATSIPTESFDALELVVDGVTEDDVKSAYKKLALKHHPDKGGSKEKFVELTEAKNKCLIYFGGK